MTNSKEWVTIKIPKATRKEAKDDDRTYEEIIQDGLAAPTDTAGDVENRDEILKRLDQIQSAQGNTVSEALDIAEGDLDRLQGQMKDIQTDVQTIKERLER